MVNNTCPSCGDDVIERQTTPQGCEYRGVGIELPSIDAYCEICKDAILKPAGLEGDEKRLQKFRSLIAVERSLRSAKKVDLCEFENCPESAIDSGKGLPICVHENGRTLFFVVPRALYEQAVQLLKGE